MGILGGHPPKEQRVRTQFLRSHNIPTGQSGHIVSMGGGHLRVGILLPSQGSAG